MILLPPFPPKNYKISSAFSYNFISALTASQPEEPDTEPEPESDMDLMAAAYREGVSEA